MKINVVHLVPKKEEVETDDYDNDLPVDCIADLYIELLGYKEWSAYCRFSNGVAMQADYENGVISIDLTQDHDKVVPGKDGSPIRISTCATTYFDDDESVVIDENGTGWTVDNLFDGLKAVVEGEKRR